MAVATDSLIPLRGGLVVPGAVVLWLLGAESRGLRFEVEQGSRLLVRPRTLVTSDDDRFIRQHRDLVLACVRYCEDLPPC